MRPIGYIQSPFYFKNGTPRQPTVCPQAHGTLTIEKSIFNNPDHSLQGLEKFSYIWIIFDFHKNNNQCTKAKVRPPRLNGQKVGVFSTRSPYRPNAIGLTLARIDKILGSTIYVSGIDLLDGTPVLDIKPYIPEYDCPLLWPSQDSQVSVQNPESYDYTNESVNHVMLPPSLYNDNYTADSLEFSYAHFSHQTNDVKNRVLNKRLTGKEGDCPNQVIDGIRRENELRHQDSEKIYDSADACISSYSKDKYDASQSCVGDMPMMTDEPLSCYEQHKVSEDCRPCYMDKENSFNNIAPCKEDNETCNHETCCHHEEVENGESTPTGDGTEYNSSHVKENEKISGLVNGFLRKVYNNNSQDSGTVYVTKGSEKTRNPCSQESIGTKPLQSSLSSALQMMHSEFTHQVSSGWINNPPISKLNVRFTPCSESQLSLFSSMAKNAEYKLQHLKNTKEAKSAILNILGEDPRSVYRRLNCCDQLYYFAVDVIHVTCWFDEDATEVVRIKPVSHVPQCSLGQAKD
ncbi:hypothetical protein CHS0354_029295 [Potamilus streckersoni]|uniref:TsaA-like domain-containing protein n=1 Tax=Potamilus streckersoni TaxID=2493646 RepID=A0AAE0T048_9BIVA|nr:hypothetical protein CHS0354_029295 [Potamilus streckersoni]